MGGWAKLPVSLRAIVTGIVIALIPANVWPPLLLSLGVPAAATIEVVFLVLYLWWASGSGPPARTRGTRAFAFRSGPLSPAQWFWGIIAAFAFAATIHAAIEQRHGAATAILVSSFFFMLLHLSKAWAMIGMVPIVFGAGGLLGVLAGTGARDESCARARWGRGAVYLVQVFCAHAYGHCINSGSHIHHRSIEDHGDNYGLWLCWVPEV